MSDEAEYRRLLAVGATYTTNLLTAANANFDLRQFSQARAQYVELASLADNEVFQISSGIKQHCVERLTQPEIALADVARKAQLSDGNTEWRYLDNASHSAVPLAGVQSDRRSVCPLVCTSDEVMDCALRMARVGRGDVVADLGCGDGRMLLRAARAGARAIGFDVNSFCLHASRDAAKQAGLESMIEVIDHDLLALSGHPAFEEANVIYAYLQPRVVQRITPLLREAVDAGKRVVIYCTTGTIEASGDGTSAPGNTLGDLAAAKVSMGGLLRMYDHGGGPGGDG
jgi:precorrin-6B methylase 2